MTNRNKKFIFRYVSSPFSVPDEEQSLPHREKRSTHSEIRGMLSITNNFEVLRRRYLDTIKERARQRKRQQLINTSQILENQDFLDSVG